MVASAMTRALAALVAVACAAVAACGGLRTTTWSCEITCGDGEALTRTFRYETNPPVEHVVEDCNWDAAQWGCEEPPTEDCVCSRQR